MSGQRSWQRVDEMWRAGRRNLTEDDLCFFYFVRDNRGFAASHDNDVMYDFKHDPTRYPPGTRAHEHKVLAIRRCAGHLASFLDANEATFGGVEVSLVPMPTSIPRSDPRFDDRIDATCEIAAERVPWVSVCKALDVRVAAEKSHLSGTRDAAVIASRLTCARMPASPAPRFAILVDDVLATGAHYAACKSAMREANPDVELMGAFLSIYVRPCDYGYRP